MTNDIKLLVLDEMIKISKQTNNEQSTKPLIIDNQLVHKINPGNVLISDVIEVSLEIGSEEGSLFYCKAYPNLQCNFIFDHPQDHYPFMLFLEMGRQMAIAVSHKYKDIPLNNIKNTVDSLNLKVHKFVELDVPLIIGCFDKIVKNKSSIQIREISFFWFQNNLCFNYVHRALQPVSIQQSSFSFRKESG